MDAAIDEHDEDCQHTLKKLREIVREVKICTEPSQCIDCINKMDDEKAFVISSGALGQHLVPQIHAMRRLDTIYIFCGNKAKHEQWAQNWSKIEGVYTSIEPICESLKKVVKQCDHDSMAISFVPKRMTTLPGQEEQVDQLEPSYMYTMLFKEIILEIKHDENKALKELVDFCRDQVSQDELALPQSTYHKKSAVWWYTCEIFLYGMLNKSLPVS